MAEHAQVESKLHQKFVGDFSGETPLPHWVLFTDAEGSGNIGMARLTTPAGSTFDFDYGQLAAFRGASIRLQAVPGSASPAIDPLDEAILTAMFGECPPLPVSTDAVVLDLGLVVSPAASAVRRMARVQTMADRECISIDGLWAGELLRSIHSIAPALVADHAWSKSLAQRASVALAALPPEAQHRLREDKPSTIFLNTVAILVERALSVEVAWNVTNANDVLRDLDELIGAVGSHTNNEVDTAPAVGIDLPAMLGGVRMGGVGAGGRSSFGRGQTVAIDESASDLIRDAYWELDDGQLVVWAGAWAASISAGRRLAVSVAQHGNVLASALALEHVDGKLTARIVLPPGTDLNQIDVGIGRGTALIALSKEVCSNRKAQFAAQRASDIALRGDRTTPGPEAAGRVLADATDLLLQHARTGDNEAKSGIRSLLDLAGDTGSAARVELARRQAGGKPEVGSLEADRLVLALGSVSGDDQNELDGFVFADSVDEPSW